ncbi:MAG: glycosyltransferase WbuB [Bacteroidia bacterium]|nr:glycosyltransferase WbuB [Bacteroidia bacterium]
MWATLTLEIRDLWPESIIAVGANLPTKVICVLEWLELKMYAEAAHVVTVGEGYREKLIEKGVLPDDISIVMNGVDTDLFEDRPFPEKLAEKWGVSGKYVCSYIGTIGMACGLNTVLQAAGKMKERDEENVVFLLVGDGAQRESLENTAKQLELSNVIFTGRQPKELMPDYLALSDCCLVHLIKSDLFKTVMPSKIFEAAGMKRPIIMGVDGPAKEIVRKAKAGVMMEPENVEDLLQCIRYLRTHPGEAKQMGEAGCHYVSRNFDRKKLAEDYLKILNALMKVPMVGTS